MGLLFEALAQIVKTEVKFIHRILGDNSNAVHKDYQIEPKDDFRELVKDIRSDYDSEDDDDDKIILSK